MIPFCGVQQLVAVSLGLVSLRAWPATTGHHQPVVARAADADAKLRERRLREFEDLREQMERIEENRAFRPLFDSEENAVIRFQAQFSRAAKALHDVLQSLDDGGSFDHTHADLFHNFLREYLINLEEMPPNHTFGATRAPDARTKKKLMSAVRAVVDAANRIDGFEDVEVLELRRDAGAEEAVQHGQRWLTRAYFLLDSRTLTYVTSQGTMAARDLRGALDAVWAALDDLVDGEGQRVVQVDEDGEPLRDQLAHFKEAMREAQVEAEFYRKNYLPNAWRDAHRRRAERIESILAPKGFYAELVKVAALKDVPELDG